MESISWGAMTHKGHVRKINEDAFVAAPPVFIVADGMGGHERGEVASGLVADQFRGLANSTDLNSDSVSDALHVVHQTIRDLRGSSDGEIGTTLSAILLMNRDKDPYWLMVNVGDSRVYHLANGVLRQISVDHSVVQELIDAGAISPEDARTHPERHVITRAVGVGSDVVADFSVHDPVAGERFLICSDGVHGQLTFDEIYSALTVNSEPQSAVDELIESVLKGRAPDNLTAVVVDLVAEPGEGRVELDDDTSPREQLVGSVTEEEPEPDPPAVVPEESSQAGSGDDSDFIKVPTW